MKHISRIHRVKYICLFSLIVAFNNFISCKVNNQLLSKENTFSTTLERSYKLHSVVDPNLLRRMLKECNSNNIQFYEENSKFYMFYKWEDKIILHTSSSINNLLFHVEDPGVAFFEGKIIFVVDYAYDNKIFRDRGNDSIVVLHSYNNDNDSFCFFDTLYNFTSAKKLDLSGIH